ncbi:MAG: oligopeptidase A, partial [Moraxellaceae bacterium]
MNNPLLEQHILPPFSAIKPEDVEPAITQIINDNRAHLRNLLEDLKNNNVQPSWNSLVAPLEEQGNKLDQAWSPVSHLNAVRNSDELRKAYNASIALLTEYGTEISQNEELYKAYEQFSKSNEYAHLSQAKKQSVDNALRDFRLGGVALSTENKKRYAEIQQRLSELSTTFSNHVLDSTQAWYKHFEEESALAGLPESALAQAVQAAEQKSLKGYVITLDFPSYYAVMMYAENRDLREEIYTAYVTRASAESKKNAGDNKIETTAEFDNTHIIAESLE